MIVELLVVVDIGEQTPNAELATKMAEALNIYVETIGIGFVFRGETEAEAKRKAAEIGGVAIPLHTKTTLPGKIGKA